MRRIIGALVLVLGLAPQALAADVATVRAQAEQGDPQAQYALGTMYRDGRGVERDAAAALRWLGSAAAQGSLDAMLALGNLHAGGLGVERNDARAYMWFDIAARQTEGDWLRDIAASNRDALTARMTAEDIAKAKRMADDWTDEHGR